MSSNKKITLIKGILISMISIVCFLIIVEVVLRIILYQRHVPTPIAIKHAVVVFREKFQKWKLQQNVDGIAKEIHFSYDQLSDMTGIQYDRDPAEMREKLVRHLFDDVGADLLNKFQNTYSEHFDELFKEVQGIQAKMAILYIPMGRPVHQEERSRSFYRSLAEDYNIPFIDSLPRLNEYKFRYVYLVPENGHMSRFGNILVSEVLISFLDRMEEYRSNFRFSAVARPSVMGDKEPNTGHISNVINGMVYREIVNKQGFRMQQDLVFPKQKQRVLFLGDSFTEGPFLANFNTYSGFLAKHYPDKDIINAGMGSYSIQDQKELFQNRAKYAEPDIVVLQVLDNDISDMFYFYRNFNNRLRFDYNPSPEELDFLKAVKALQRQ